MKYLLLLLFVACTAKQPEYKCVEYIATPSAKGKPVSGPVTVFIDTDGFQGTVDVFGAVNCPPYRNSPVVLDSLRSRFRGFAISFTGSENDWKRARGLKIRCVVSPGGNWQVGRSGVAVTGSLGQDIPAFVFPDRLGNNDDYIANICSHEVGHVLGLRHQSEYDTACNLKLTYRQRAIMGFPDPRLGVPVWYNTTQCTFQNDTLILRTVLK